MNTSSLYAGLSSQVSCDVFHLALLDLTWNKGGSLLETIYARKNNNTKVIMFRVEEKITLS